MPSHLPKFTLRIPSELLDKVRVLAELNCRSVNKEIEMVLKTYVEENSDKF
ncbi:Arc family DNA-binding protein [Clostridium baratii]